MKTTTKTCRSCWTEIDRRATRCPQCRTRQRRPLRTFLGGIVLFLVVAGVIGAASGGNNAAPASGGASPALSDAQPTDVPQPTDAPTAAPTAVPVLRVNATTMAEQYDANKVAAQGYYKGRVVQTTGIATNISQDILGSYYVALKPSGYDGWTSMQCYVADAAATSSAVNGQPVTIRGTVDDMTLGIIAFKDCSLVQ